MHPCRGRLVTMRTPVFFFSLSGPVCFLMYLSAQLAQIASSIIGTRYENVDPCTVAQTHRYDCKREASRGRPTSKSEMGEGEHECVSGEEERKEKAGPSNYNESIHSLYFLSLKETQFLSNSVHNENYCSSPYGLSSLFALSMEIKSNKFTMIHLLSVFKDRWSAT